MWKVAAMAVALAMVATVVRADENRLAAEAKKSLACSTASSVSPKLLFDNTGFRHSDGAVAELYGECSLVSGLYVAGYRAQSLVRSTRGNEWDFITGYRWSAGGFDHDIRWHYYWFDIGGGVSLQQLGAQYKISRTVKLGGWSLTTTGVVDVGRIEEIRSNILGIAIGASAKHSLDFLWGTPTLGITGKAWHYLETPAPNKGTPIYSLAVGLDYKISGTTCSIGPSIMVVQNDLLGPDPHKTSVGGKLTLGCSH